MTEWVPQKETVNRHYYLRVLTTLGERVRIKRPGKTTVGSCIETMRRLTMPYLLSGFWPKIERQCYNTHPYSQDLTPYDFWLFPKSKNALKATRFESVEVVKTRKGFPTLFRLMKNTDGAMY